MPVLAGILVLVGWASGIGVYSLAFSVDGPSQPDDRVLDRRGPGHLEHRAERARRDHGPQRSRRRRR